MTDRPAELRSGKSHRDENFPVASHLIHPRHRGAILAFYEFVRTADDIADHASLAEGEKLAHLDQLEASLLGKDDQVPVGVRLRTVLRERSLAPRHALDLLTAFRMDVTKLRYQDWDDLMNYCSYSAMPVGRFVCDVHGEDRAVWPANDALCAALQIINHLQDCGADYRNLNRVYVPLDALEASHAGVEDLGRPVAPATLRDCLRKLALRTGTLLDQSSAFSPRIADFRLAMEVAVIQALARRLTTLLVARDPLSESVHLKAPAVALAGLTGIVTGTFQRMERALAPLARSYRA
ncbi:MAG TPA: squalene synthase HpnC [Xanthobacteraceae bacterium]|nr:squalene synthase HpnC [Xanthobacteraceae bacterium]